MIDNIKFDYGTGGDMPAHRQNTERVNYNQAIKHTNNACASPCS